MDGTRTEQVEAVSAERLVEQAPDAVIFADRSGRVRTWNAAAERIFGHAAGAMMGESLDAIIPEQFRDAHWTGFERALAEGRTKYVGQALPTKARTVSGDEIYVELSFAIVLDDGGAAIGALAHARDITERFQRDRETRRRIRELEQELADLRGGAEQSSGRS